MCIETKTLWLAGHQKTKRRENDAVKCANKFKVTIFLLTLVFQC